MKKFFLTLVVALMSVPTFAQYSSGGFSLSGSSVYYGIRLGGAIAGVSTDPNQHLGSKFGLTLGGVVGIRLSDATPLFLESGLYFSGRGGKHDYTDENGDKVKDNLGLNYLEIPILIKYGIQATDDIHVLPFVGPTFALGIAGKNKTEIAGTTVSKESSFTKSGGFRPFDMGIKIGCGAEYNMVYLELGYQFGLANIARSYEDNGKNYDPSAHNHNFFFNIGVNF